MKKITRILSLVLVFAMLTLAFAACGGKKPTTAEKVADAMAKIATATKTDCEATITLKVIAAGSTTQIPMTVATKVDATNASNPVVLVETSLTIDKTAVKTSVFYKDGVAYTDANGTKTKTAISYADMISGGNTGFDTASIFAAKKDAINESFVITENADGTISVQMTVTKAEFATGLNAFASSVAANLGSGNTAEIGDTVFNFTVDANGNITEMTTNMAITMNIGGETATATYDMTFKYNSVGDGFAVNPPADLSSYK